jgi:hypothetical protein
MISEMQGWPFCGAASGTPRARARATTAGAGPTAESAARLPRIPVARVEHFMLADLSPAERAKLVDDTYRISLAYFPDDDRDGFEQAFFSGDTTWTFLFYGANGALAGFSAVSCLWVSHEGQDHAVFKGVTCVDARYKLTWRSRMPVMLEAALFKLRHPRTPAGYMGMAASPSGYRLLASSVPRLYPSRHAAMPETIKALVLKATRMRGFEPVDEERLLVSATSRLAQPERLRSSRSLKDDPDARFFVEQNPDFDRFYMLVWVPLDLGNLARGAARTLLRHVLGDGRRAR